MAGATVQLDDTIYRILEGAQNYDSYNTPLFDSTLHEGPHQRGVVTSESDVTWAGFHRGCGLTTYDPQDPYRYLRGRNVDCRFHDFVFLCGLIVATTVMSVAPTKMLQWGTSLYAISGRYVYRTSSGTTWTEVHDGGASAVATDIFDADGTLVVCYGTTVGFAYSTDGASWTTSSRSTTPGGGTSQDRYPHYGLMLNDQVYFFYRPNEMRAAGANNDVTNGGSSFGGNTWIGSSGTSFRGAAVYRDRLIMKKDEGLFSVNVDGIVQEITRFRDQIDQNDLIAAEWQGDGLWYFKWGTKLLAYNGEEIVQAMGTTPRFANVGPEQWTATDENVSAEVTALLATDRWLWAAVKDNQTSVEYRLMCRGYTDAGAPPVWHDMNVIGTDACNALGWLAQTSSQNPRLYMGVGASASYIVQPVTEFPPDDPGYAFTSLGELYLCDHHGQSPAWRKNYYSLYHEARNLSNANGRYVDVHYRLDHDGSFGENALGRILDEEPLRFPEDVTGRHIQLRLKLATGASTSSPVLTFVTLEYDHEPPIQRFHRFYVTLGKASTGQSDLDRQRKLDALIDRGGQVDFRDGLLRRNWKAKVVEIGQTQVKRRPAATEDEADIVVPIVVKLARQQSGAAYFYDTTAAYTTDAADVTATYTDTAHTSVATYA